MSITPDQVLDCSGMACPMPIIKTKQAIDTLEPGQVLKMIATDPGSTSDVTAWTSRTGNPLVEAEQDGASFVFFIEKKR
jgi:tRNA 2-thiouridine synthesizing protein A